VNPNAVEGVEVNGIGLDHLDHPDDLADV